MNRCKKIINVTICILFLINSFTIQSCNNESSSISMQESNLLSVTIISYTKELYAGETAHLKIKGTPNTIYTLNVIYPSGKSKASGLGDEKSDKDGYVSWSWKVGTNTSSGTHSIVVTNNSKSKAINFKVN